MRLETKAIMTIALASASLFGASGCKGEKDFDLQDIHLISSQVTAFSLQRAKYNSTQSNNDLLGYAFSIANNLNEGAIENATPLPYQLELDSVRFNIRLMGDTARTSIDLAFGSGAFAPYKSDSIYSITSDVRQLRLRITYRNTNAQGGVTPYEYNYRITLRQYINNPETISWQEASSLASPLLTGSDLYYIPQTGQSSVRLWEVSSSATASHNLTYSPSSISAQNLSDRGLPTGETIKQVAGYDNYIYALSSAGSLYRLVNEVWIPMEGSVRAEELLGVFPPRSSTSAPSLALIATRNGERAFARYENGVLTTSSSVIPSTFPSASNATKVYRQPFTENLLHIGPSITLLGVNNTSTGIVRSAWYTTDGLDWIQRYVSRSETSSVASSVAFVKVSNRYYRLETDSEGLAVYTSADSGVSWLKNGSVALPTGSIASGLANAPIMGWAGDDQTLYIYRGASSGTGALLVGTLLRDEINY